MGWAGFAIEALKKGQTIKIRPRGNSMRGKINDRDLVTIAPCDSRTLEINDIVLCKVHGHEYLHLIKAKNGNRFLIGNNIGATNGWIGEHCIFGKAIKIEK